MSEENINLQPNDTLSQPTDSKKNPNRFILFTGSWLNLQNYITTCLELPITKDDFGAKYGDFSDVHQVQQVVAAMKKVQALTVDFGSPKTIKDKGDAAYLLKDEPPNEIYAHMIWLAMQIQGAASTFTHTLGSIKEVLSPTMGTKEERASYLRDILIGNGGLISVAQDMIKKTNVLREKVRKFGGKIEDGNQELARYTSQQSTVVKAANEAIAEIKRTLDRMDLESKAALKAWRDFTIAAAVASVGLAILSCLCLVLAPFTFGTTLAVAGGLGAAAIAAATALGVAATAQLKEYNRLCGDIKKEEGKKQQKVLLVSDLNSLNEKIIVVGGGMNDFLTNLNTIEGIWLDIAGKLTYICSNYTPEKLSDYVWIQQAMKITDATRKWHEIGQITTEFTQNSLVNYQSGTFGTPVEEKGVAA